MKVTFLHLSDLHFRPDWPEEMDSVCKALKEDLASLGVTRHYTVFSGDLVLSGAASDSYRALSSSLAASISPKDRRICVPGNHDLSQEGLRKQLIIRNGALDALTSERAFNDSLGPLTTHYFLDQFSNYRSFEETFARYRCCDSDGFGGTGWELEADLGLYCLNTALCSSAGLKAEDGSVISDRGRLMVDTRSLNQWLATTEAKTKVLVMHHPTDWYVDWARNELESIIAKEFQLVFSGHVHKSDAVRASRGDQGVVQIGAPALFTRKSERLGFSIVTLDTETHAVEVEYRQWAAAGRVFVMGTVLAGHDTGKLIFGPSDSDPDVTAPPANHDDDVTSLGILQMEFDEAITSYSSKRVWVDRDLADRPETDSENAILTATADLIGNLRSCVIRAPTQFGLTALGRFIALEHQKICTSSAVVAMLYAPDVGGHKRGVTESIETRCEELLTVSANLAAIIVDNCNADKHSRRVLREIRAAYPGVPVIALQSVDDCARIGDSFEPDELERPETFYLWALTRSRIRELVTAYVDDRDDLDEDLVTSKVISDIDSLNIHRTPLNCLMILKLVEQVFDESPVNRTEMIGRVLTLLFYQFHHVPRYAIKPDLKDCEYALGYFCEKLVRQERTSFSKEEFCATAREYCQTRLLDLDIDVLFNFLVIENILVRRAFVFEFRFTYWLYYFAAHRMHHSHDFATFVLDGWRYSAHPELIEFYSGIDRRRTDAVVRLTSDLKKMNADFLLRTGIMADFNPYATASWEPDTASIERLQQEIASSMAESTLPAVVKDSIADTGYDRAHPYHQELSRFIEESSLKQLMYSLRGAARVLRNSDHVDPTEKTALLDEVLSGWQRVCQILVMLSPVLAAHRKAAFENMAFVLSEDFAGGTLNDLWSQVMTHIPDNVLSWYGEDLFSKKMGALLGNHLMNHQAELTEFLVLLMMVKQRPVGWERHVEKFLVRERKNSFYVGRVFALLRSEFRVSFSTERTRQELRRLAAMAVAKHQTGAKHPNMALVEKAARALDAQK